MIIATRNRLIHGYLGIDVDDPLAAPAPKPDSLEPQRVASCALAAGLRATKPMTGTR